MKITRRKLRKILMEVVRKELIVEDFGKRLTFAGKQVPNPISKYHNLSDDEEEKMKAMIVKVGRELERFDMLEFALVELARFSEKEDKFSLGPKEGPQGFGFSFGFTRESDVKSGALKTVLKFLKQRIPEYDFSISSIANAARKDFYLGLVAGTDVIVVRSLD